MSFERYTMPKIALAVALALPVAHAWAASATPAAARPSPQARPAAAVTTPASASPASSQSRDGIDGVVAAALVGALSEQLGGRSIKISLDQVNVETTSIRDRLVSGHGKLRIDTEEDWIGFRFNALYDTQLQSAGYPELSIGGSGGNERVVPNDSYLVRQLDDRVIAMLGDEFGYQHVRLQLDRIDTIEAGTRYLRIDATGIADFGRDGSAPARVEALYDRKNQQWLRVAYVLEPQPVVSAYSTAAGR